MKRDSNRLMQSLFLSGNDQNLHTGWQPPIDVYQCSNGYLVKADLAGVRPEDIQVSFQGNHLIIRGVRRDCQFEKGYCHILLEIAYHQFERQIPLPIDLQGMHISTQYDHGMVLIRIQPEAP